MKRAFYLRYAIAALLLLAALAGSAGAATLVVNATPIPPTKTDWVGQVLALQQFDPTLGTLISVDVKFTSGVEGIVGVENLGTAAPVTLKLSASTQITQGATLITTLNPSDTRTINLTAADGVLDWGGTSGHVYTDFAGTDTASFLYNTPATMAAFIGLSTVDYTAAATATSQTNGSGNIASYYMTKASADATVTYTFREIPEPGSLLALATGLIGVVGLVTRKKQQSC